MHAPALYLDTSVIGGYFDVEFMADTRVLWRLRDTGKFRFISSEMVIDEVALAPARVRELMQATFAPDDVLPVSEEMEELAAAYMAQRVVPAAYADDALSMSPCALSPGSTTS